MSEPSMWEGDSLHVPLVPVGAEDQGLPRQKKNTACSPTVFAYTCNFILGAGALSLPLTISRAGVIGSIVFMAFMGFVSSVTMIWVVEACGRAEAFKQEGEEEEDSIQAAPPPHMARRGEGQGDNPFHISSRRVEVNQLSSLFLGSRMGGLYSGSLMMYSLCTMWLYAAIFSRSLTESIPLMGASHCDLATVSLSELDPLCHKTYLVYLATFTAITMALSVFELAGQKLVQTSLSALAMLSLFAMVSTMIVEAIRHPYESGGGISPSPSPSEPVALAVDLAPEPRPGYEPGPLFFNVKEFGAAYMNFIFAFMAQHAAPGLVQLTENKQGVPKTFIFAMGVIFMIYSLLGGIAALYFGVDPIHGVKSLLSLNWYNFNGDVDSSQPGSIFTKAISFIIRLYPCISVSGAFVLFADTLASSLRMAIGGRCAKSSQGLKVLSRWILILVSVTGAAFMVKITFLVSLCAVIGVNLVMTFPALLQIYSSRRCEQQFGHSRTPYSWHFSKPTYAWAMLALAAVSVAVGIDALVTSLS